jgi:DNA repair protein RecN (Recombination protein N)
MIEEIYIRDLGVIQEARLPFGKGLTVITGETGAGKTMVLSALGLLLGERADSSTVRRGQDQAFVEGRWLIGESSLVIDRIRDAGSEVEQGELILNRSVSNEGRSRASVSGRSTPVGLLTELGEMLVVVHGQSDQIRLKSAVAQREALDQFGGPELASVLGDYQKTYKAWRDLTQRLEDLKASVDAREAEAAELRASVIELEKLQALPGEDVELSEKAERLNNLEILRAAAALAHEALSSEGFSDAPDALGLIGQARRSLEQVANHDPELGRLAEQLKEVSVQLADASGEISSYLASLDLEGAGEINLIQDRRAALTAAMRKYGPTLEDVIAYLGTASDRLLELDSSSDTIDQLGVEFQELSENLKTQADSLTAIRRSAATRLSELVTSELKELAMGGASLVVEVVYADAYSSHGQDAISIQLSSYPGAEPRPLGKGASGGELSRIMLAIEVVLAETQQAPTFIFDEVDAGVGGAAAIEVGRRLAMLAQRAQVIVVTHLAQVAAYANAHLRVLKTSSTEFTATDVVALDNNARVEELARMLSGLSDSQSGLAHAAELRERALAEFSRP